MIDVLDNVRDRDLICTWIGTHIESINAHVRSHLLTCHDCFRPAMRRPMQIFAVPLASSCGLDGFCNISTTPVTIAIDVGRVVPQHWLSLVVHEYAHAHLGSAGHHAEFATVLTHLCFVLGLRPPLNQTEEILRRSPPYLPTSDPLAFWRGETGW
jgi:hypothetical protein